MDVILVAGWWQLEFDLCVCAMFGRQVNWGEIVCTIFGSKKVKETISLLCLETKKLDFCFVGGVGWGGGVFHFHDFIKLNENFKMLMWFFLFHVSDNEGF